MSGAFEALFDGLMDARDATTAELGEQSYAPHHGHQLQELQTSITLFCGDQELLKVGCSRR